MEENLTEHGFIAINNDPNVGYEKKFYKGKAEDLPVDIKYIMGCERAWKQNATQLKDIITGKYQEKMDRIKRLSERNIFKDINSCPPEDL